MSDLIGETPHIKVLKVSPITYRIVKTPEYANLPDWFDHDEVLDKGDSICDISNILTEEFCLVNRLGDPLSVGEDSSGYDFNNVILSTMLNAEAHGNRYDPTKTITVECEAEGEKSDVRVGLKVMDEGTGFDYGHLVQCARQAGSGASYNDFRDSVPDDSGGFALFEILAYCDSVSWNEVGNQIYAQKRIVVPNRE